MTRRDALPGQLCSCSHLVEEHDIATKAQACSTCTCARFVLRWLRWRETSYVYEEVST